MRRAWAYLLLVLIGFSPIGPALFVDADENLPACCRRAGKHHCAAVHTPSGPSLLAARCSEFPAAGTVAARIAAALLPTKSAWAFLAACSVTVCLVFFNPVSSFGRSHRLRGPPAFFSFVA